MSRYIAHEHHFSACHAEVFQRVERSFAQRRKVWDDHCVVFHLADGKAALRLFILRRKHRLAYEIKIHTVCYQPTRKIAEEIVLLANCRRRAVVRSVSKPETLYRMNNSDTNICFAARHSGVHSRKVILYESVFLIPR